MLRDLIGFTPPPSFHVLLSATMISGSMPKRPNPFRMTRILILTEQERMLREYEKNLAMALKSAAKIANSMREMVAWYSNKVHVV